MSLEFRGIREVPVSHKATLGRITQLLYGFKESRKTLQVPDVSDSFEKKLYSTYLSCIPDNEYVYDLNMHCDHRGSFTEIIRTPERGQFPLTFQIRALQRVSIGITASGKFLLLCTARHV